MGLWPWQSCRGLRGRLRFRPAPGSQAADAAAERAERRTPPACGAPGRRGWRAHRTAALCLRPGAPRAAGPAAGGCGRAGRTGAPGRHVRRDAAIPGLAGPPAGRRRGRRHRHAQGADLNRVPASSSSLPASLGHIAAPAMLAGQAGLTGPAPGFLSNVGQLMRWPAGAARQPFCFLAAPATYDHGLMQGPVVLLTCWRQGERERQAPYV